jgi:hypothetical protein
VKSAVVVAVITDDLVDSPTPENCELVRGFTRFLAELGKEKPVVVLRNHDVKGDGIGLSDYAQAMKLLEDPSIQTGRVVWVDRSRIGLIRFSSVERAAKLARGGIIKTELIDSEQILGRDERSGTYMLLVLVYIIIRLNSRRLSGIEVRGTNDCADLFSACSMRQKAQLSSSLGYRLVG